MDKKQELLLHEPVFLTVQTEGVKESDKTGPSERSYLQTWSSAEPALLKLTMKMWREESYLKNLTAQQQAKGQSTFGVCGSITRETGTSFISISDKTMADNMHNNALMFALSGQIVAATVLWRWTRLRMVILAHEGNNPVP